MSVHAVNTMYGSGHRRRRVAGDTQEGEGFFGDVWDGIKSIGRAAKGVHDYVKDKKLISTVAGLIPHPTAQKVAAGAKMAGYGKKRKMAGGRKRKRVAGKP